MRSRRSVRLPDYDYRVPGVYFVTICTQERRLFFDEPEVKEAAEDCWQRIPEHNAEVRLDAWVVMPNHVHGLVVIETPGGGVQLNAPTNRVSMTKYSAISPQAGTLAVIVRTFKAAVTTQCRRTGHSEFGWQCNYYEHIVRDEDDLLRIRQYIADNPLEWDLDEYNPARVAIRA